MASADGASVGRDPRPQVGALLGYRAWGRGYIAFGGISINISIKREDKNIHSLKIWLQHKGPSDPKVILPDEQTDNRIKAS